MVVLFISFDRLPLLASILNIADPPFALVITPCFYLNHVEVANQYPGYWQSIGRHII